jgi:D-serine deaminase-like pyridoxal phosphate-dependent protein
MAIFRIPGSRPYRIDDPEKFSTPRLLVFRDRVEENLKQMRLCLEKTAPGEAFSSLCPHVKTHKSEWTTRRMMAFGIDSFKATPNELDMLCECGPGEIFLAYPLLLKDALRVAEAAKRYPDIRFFVQMGSAAHRDILIRAARETEAGWDVYLDVDVGMHRTGMDAGAVLEFYKTSFPHPDLRFAGFHGYDGHVHHEKEGDRIREARKAMKVIVDLVRRFQDESIPVPRVMAAGSPTFDTDFRILYEELEPETRIQVSPGTWIYWDSGYDRLMPGAFQYAALILAQVMDDGDGWYTLNLGHKRWGADQGPVERFSHPHMEVISFSEEHTVVKTEGKPLLRVGDYVLVVPRHICSTVNLYETFVLVNKEGDVENDSVAVDARNR